MLPSPAVRNTRRSTRVYAQVPLIVSGVDSKGTAFRTPGETLVVNKHGAKIRTSQRLQPGMDITISPADSEQTQRARVVWVDEVFATVAELDFGIELENPENFWGVYFPPSDWQEPDSWEEEEEPAPATAREPQTSQQPGQLASPAASSQSDSSPCEIPARGVEVFIRGTSAVQIPFQEKTVLRPVNEYEATIYVRPVVDLGVRVQVVIPGTNRSLKARTSAVGAQREKGKWKMWIKFAEPVRFVAEEPQPAD